MPGKVRVSPARKLAWTAVLFVAALVALAVSAATHSVVPLFVAWAPLLVVPWVLTRPGPDEPEEQASAPSSERAGET